MKPFKSPADLTEEEMLLSEKDLLKIEELRKEGKAKQKVFPEGEVAFEDEDKMSYEEFYYKYLNDHREAKNWRDGQYFFNLLWLYRRDLASTIRGMEGIDPFHRDDLIPACAAWLKEHWNETQEIVIRKSPLKMAYENISLSQEEADALDDIIEKGLARPTVEVSDKKGK